jgi:hypothetical protein
MLSIILVLIYTFTYSHASLEYNKMEFNLTGKSSHGIHGMQNVSSGRINSYYASMDDLQYVVSCDV